MNYRRLRFAVIAIAVLMFSATFVFSFVYAAQPPPVAKIVSLDYPRHVPAGKTFAVTIVADYSDRVGVDMGIWDIQTGNVVQSISIPLRETGKTIFTFKLTAPTSTVDWHLLAITRIWWQDAWYQDPLEGSQPFTIRISETVTVVLMSPAAASTMSFDGSQYPVNNTNPLILSVEPGVHRLEASPLLQVQVGKRLVFAGWSDSVNSNPRQIMIRSDISIAALYRTEYYLTVKSERGRVSGEGWYPEGSQPSFAIAPTSSALSWHDLLTENYVFAGWSGDSNSSDALASVTMNGPKSVEAKWSSSGMTINPTILSYAFLLGTLILAVRGIHRYSKGRVVRTSFRATQQWARLIVLTMVLAVVLISISPAYAQLPIQSGKSVVKIGDASWYYWNNTASDTCLLWLGGGTTEERDIGYYSYRINPFQYESFGTIRFMQDLAKYYCVIALERGSYEAFSPNSNRTIYQEPYQMDSRIIGDVHDWIRKQGYAHVFLVGYSTGAQVAAMEVALRAPEEWMSPDGLVLITPRLSNIVSQSAYRIRASLLVLYGGSIETPAYVTTGHGFYVNAPQDGWYGSHYFHKEFRVIERMGHEVWTTYEDGSYDTQAIHSLVGFIDDVKSLQFTSHDVATIAHAMNNLSATMSAGLNLTSVRAPNEISSASIMRIKVAFTYDVQAPTVTQLIAFNLQSGEIENAAEFVLMGSGDLVINLDILPSSNSSELSLGIIASVRADEGWQPTAKPLFTKTRMVETVHVTFVSAIPNMPLIFDGSQYKTAENGVLHLETKPGVHTAQVESVTYLDPLTRIVFAGWDDGSAEVTREVTLENGTGLFANYRIQYFVNATSAYGQSNGSGWYDEDSTAAISVEPPLVNGSALIFARWTGDESSNDVRSLLTVDSQKTMRAEWISVAREPNGPNTPFWLVFSLVLFAIALTWNLRHTDSPNPPVHS